MEIHVKPEHRYDCCICRQDFKQVLGLAEHVYMHEKCDDYTCPHCQKDFTDKNKTRRHIEQIHAKKGFTAMIAQRAPLGGTGRRLPWQDMRSQEISCVMVVPRNVKVKTS